MPNHVFPGTGSTITAGAGVANSTWKIWSQSATVTSASTTTWVQWVDAVVSSSSPNSTNPWVQWVDAVSSSTTNSANPVWDAWCRPTETMLQGGVAAAARAVSAEERARWAAREAELNRVADVERAARKLADAKAEVLLRQLLTPEQQEDLDKKRCFYLHSGGKKYRIDRGRTGNVKLVDEQDQVVESYCIHPSVACPDADTMLAQKLLLETDIETFERVANITARSWRGRNRSGQGLARAQG